MPPKKVNKQEIIPVEETAEERLEARIAALETMVAKLYKHHYNPLG
jgi:hypothetical protein